MTQAELHDQCVRTLMRMLTGPMANGQCGLDTTQRMLESLVLGFMLTGEQLGRSGPIMLDQIYAHVQARYETHAAVRARS